MSKKQQSGYRGEAKARRKKDARIRRTDQRLGMALMELILDKPMDSITVQEVLDRASVGRSTFYLHFRDTNDLLLSQLEMFLETMSTMLTVKKDPSRRLAPVTEMFEHVGGQNKIYRALAESGRLHDFFDLAQGYFARGIEQRLTETKHEANAAQLERAVLAIGLAGSLLSLFRWWIETGGKVPARKMDELFHRIAWCEKWNRNV
jgi:AcrR family transcriptional regulator